jgi:hypothetical protein
MRYVFDNETSFDVIKARMYTDLPNRVIILDGSAKYSTTKWDGFTIYQVDAHSQILYDRITLHPFAGNPTKTNVRETFGEFADHIVECITSKPVKEVCIISNKLQPEALEESERFNAFLSHFQSKGIEIVKLFRGTVIGSNLARSSDTLCIFSSIFDGIGPTALRTALRTGQSIAADRLWSYRTVSQKDGSTAVVKNPRLRDGFLDPELNETFLRLYANELIQYILRGRARNYADETEDVFFYSTGDLINEELRSQLPGVQFAGASGLEKLHSMTRDQLESISLRALAGLFGYQSPNEKTSRDLRRLRDLVYIDKFG